MLVAFTGRANLRSLWLSYVGHLGYSSGFVHMGIGVLGLRQHVLMLEQILKVGVILIQRLYMTNGRCDA